MSDSLSSTVCTWALSPSQKQPAESALLIGPNVEATETAFSDDTRQVVDAVDIKPGGKYYSIVKLQIRYEKQTPDDTRWAQGSGWLIKPDLLVTAGHCSYDHTYGLGRAAEVKAYVGYNGKDSIGLPDVQFSHGARILTTSGWIQSEVNRQNDVSFIQLDAPFENVIPFTFQPTPVTGNLALGVVGYPADQTLNKEVAAQMYAQYKTVNFDLSKSTLNMLEYTVSTFAGQSGSPVILQNQNVSIGTHVYGLGVKNSASVIRGHYGNFYTSYQTALLQKIPSPKAGDLYTVLNVPATGPEDSMETVPSDAEDFWSTLKSVVNVGANIGQTVLSAGTPFLGPVGGPIAAIAGTALGFASKLTESSMGTESAMGVDQSYKQHACRAILSEAALQAVLKMDASKAQQFKVFDQMQQIYTTQKSHVADVARSLGPTLMEPALRVALASSVPSTSGSVQYPVVAPPPGTESALGTAGQPFIDGLHSAAKSRPGETEDFFDFIGSVASTIVNVAPPVLSAIGGIVKAVGGESAMEPLGGGLQPDFEAVYNRALMGDAALQAISSIPPDELKAEGFFDSIVDTVKSIGTTVLKVAPSVIRTVAPIVQQVVQASTGGETKLLPVQPPHTLKPTKSISDLLKDDSVTQPPSTLTAQMNGVPNGVASKTFQTPNGISVSVAG